MTAIVLRGDARHLPLPDDSADLIVTSPPYFGLRSYTDAGEHYDGQIGSEPTPAAYIEALVDCTREWIRVLKPSGSLWVNLGDKYAGSTPPGSGGTGPASRIQLTHPGSMTPRRADSRRPDYGGAPMKSLLGLPWRYALACTDQLGLILRAEVIWSKPNGLPESVTDRVRRSHEQWFHLTRMPRYYSAVDEIREPVRFPEAARWSRAPDDKWHNRTDGGDDRFRATQRIPHPLGKLPSSVWEINDDPPSLIRSVLSAIHAGSLTVDEGERILTGAAWTGSNGTGPMWISQATAGSGPEGAHPRATASSGSTAEPSWPTAPATPSQQADSPTQACNSTTPAASAIASDASTSNPSPFAKTSCAAPLPSPPSTQPRRAASTTTSSPTPTPTAHQTGSACAANACEPVTAAPTGARRASPSPDGPGSVWTIPSQPLTVPPSLGVDHFAAFPMEWPRRIIQGWSPTGICTACGEGRRPVADKELSGPSAWRSPTKDRYTVGRHNKTDRAWAVREITGYTCACPDAAAPTRPAVVLDPFGGTGTTALLADVLGRTGISIDRSADYSRLALWRTTDPAQRAAAMQVDKPPAQVNGQEAMFTT